MNLRKALLRDEGRHRPGPAPWTTVQADTGIVERMRRILVDWMAEVVLLEECPQCVLFHAMNYVDRFVGTKEITPGRLQCLGAAALLVASKIYEVCAVSAETLAYLATTTKEKLLKMEGILISTLNYKLTCVTVMEFLTDHLDGAPIGDRKTIEYLATASLLNYQLQSHFKPSEIAGAIIFLCNGAPTTEKRSWTAVCLAVWDHKVWTHDKVTWLGTAKMLRDKAPVLYNNPWTKTTFMV